MNRRTMPSAEQLRDWGRQGPGSWVVACETRVLRKFTSDLFGYHLLQVGGLPLELDYLADCQIRSKIRIDQQPAALAQGSFVEGAPENLPVKSDSVDTVVLPHTLDFSADPYQVLREVDRVLIPGGRVLLTGFNPYSLWGLLRLVPGRKTEMPWCGHFLSYPRIQDWLSLMGFAVESVEVRVFRPPLQRESLIRRSHFLEKYGPRFIPMLAGVYILRAVKQVSTLTPVGPRWSRLRRLEASTVKPTTREQPYG